MDIALDYYRIFEAVARHRSFTRAAEALVNSQPNLTRAVHNLEAELGCRLFLRSSRGVELTPEGEALYAHVTAAMEQLRAGEAELQRQRELRSGMVSIACSETALPAVLYYQKHRTKRGAAVGLLLGTVAGVIVAILTNVFLIFPAYMALYGMDWAAIVQMCTAVNPWITNVPTMVAFSIVPFNVISFGVTSILAMLLYKKISVPLKKFAMIG